MLIRGVLNSNDHKCVGSCDMNEGVDHLFARCEFFGRIWYLISDWFGFVIVTTRFLLDKFLHFGYLGG